MQHFKFVNSWFRFFDVTNRLLMQVLNSTDEPNRELEIWNDFVVCNQLSTKPTSCRHVINDLRILNIPCSIFRWHLFSLFKKKTQYFFHAWYHMRGFSYVFHAKNMLKSMFSKKASKIDEIFTVDLTFM